MVEYRAATPTDSEAARCLYLAADEVFHYIFGKDNVPEFFLVEFRAPRGLFSHANTLVAQQDERVVGAAACYPGLAYTRLYVATVWHAVRFFGLGALPAALARARRVDSVIPPPDRDVYYLECLGVLPESRRQGIGGELFRRSIEQARMLGLSRLQLDTSTAKPSNRAMYEAYGFTVVGQNRFRGPREAGIPDYT